MSARNPAIISCSISGYGSGGASAFEGRPGYDAIIQAASGIMSLTGATDATATADTGLVLLEGTPAVYSAAFDAMVVDDAAPTIPVPASGHIGAILQSADWAMGWTYGIFDGARAQPLWFE